MTRKNPRGLRPDEEELWDKVRHSTVPLHPTKRQAIKEAIEGHRPKTPTFSVPEFSIGEAATATAMPHDIAPSRSDQLATAPVHMDRKNFGRLKRGKLAPEGRIDLHGMTLAQAHPALTRFILGSHASGRRLVLVITGKGKVKFDEGPIPTRQGVLKHQVPHWLQSGALRPAVLQIAEAHARHGGSGAYYVYLRRQR